MFFYLLIVFEVKFDFFLADLRFEAKRAKWAVLKASSSGVLEVNSKQSVTVEKSNDPIVVIDNYDSFTYNLCQVCVFLLKLKIKLDE